MLLYCYLAPVRGAGDAVTSANLPLPCKRWAVSSCSCVLAETATTQLVTLREKGRCCAASVHGRHCLGSSFSKDQLVQLLYRVAEKFSQAVHYSASIDVLPMVKFGRMEGHRNAHRFLADTHGLLYSIFDAEVVRVEISLIFVVSLRPKGAAFGQAGSTRLDPTRLDSTRLD